MHRRCGEETRVAENKPWNSFYNFMEHRVSEEDYDYADVWGVEDWQDFVQWESKCKKNFGMNVVY